MKILVEIENPTFDWLEYAGAIDNGIFALDKDSVVFMAIQ